MNSFEVRQIFVGEEMKALYQGHFMRDFPSDELKSLDLMEKLMKKNINTVWVAEREGKLLGYYALAREPGNPLVLLDFLAVEPEQRDKGIGSALMKAILAQLREGESLIIESERVDYARSEEERINRQRRIQFYLRAGAVLRREWVKLFGVEYSLLTIGNAPESVEAYYWSCARTMLPEEILKKNLLFYSS
jgi:GNAT superfamily N-acetyltransferase